MEKMKRDKQGKYSDKNQVSAEKYEQRYVRKAAKRILDKLEKENEPGDRITIPARTLFRLCQAIVKA